MSIFSLNSELFNQILNEANDEEEKEDFSIDDDQFNDDEDDTTDSTDAQAKAVDDIMSDDSDGDTGDEAESSSDAQDQAADDIMSDDGGSDEGNTGGEESSDTGEDSRDSGEESGEDNFEINMGDDEDSGDGESMDDSEGDGGSTDDGSGDEESSEDVTNELIEKEKELFSDLSEKQLSIRTNELKGLYVKLTDTIESTSDRLSSSPNNKINSKIIKFLVSKLDALKKMVDDYMVDTFETKTYIENTIYYHKCLMQLNLVKDILKEMSSKTEKQGKQD